jgi:hypothetical protein
MVRDLTISLIGLLLIVVAAHELLEPHRHKRRRRYRGV